MTKIWVIYQKPSDFPHAHFVMRTHEISRDENGKLLTKTADKFSIAGDIYRLRRQIPHGKQRMERTELDPLQILEWWY